MAQRVADDGSSTESEIFDDDALGASEGPEERGGEALGRGNEARGCELKLRGGEGAGLQEEKAGERTTKFPAASVVDGARARPTAVTDSDLSVGEERTLGTRLEASAGLATALRKPSSRRARGLSVSFADEQKERSGRERSRSEVDAPHATVNESRQQDTLNRDGGRSSEKWSERTYKRGSSRERDGRYHYEDSDRKDRYHTERRYDDDRYATTSRSLDCERFHSRDELYRDERDDPLTCPSSNAERYSESWLRNSHESSRDNDFNRNSGYDYRHRQDFSGSRSNMAHDSTSTDRSCAYTDLGMLHSGDRAPIGPLRLSGSSDIAASSRSPIQSAPGDDRPPADDSNHFPRPYMSYSADKLHHDWSGNQSEGYRQKRPDPVSTWHNLCQHSDYQQITSPQQPVRSLLSPRDPRLASRDPRLVSRNPQLPAEDSKMLQQNRPCRSYSLDNQRRDCSWSEQQVHSPDNLHSFQSPARANNQTRSYSVDLSTPTAYQQQGQRASSWVDRFGATSSSLHDPRRDHQSLPLEETRNGFATSQQVDRPSLPETPSRPSHRLKIQGVSESCISRIHRFKISTRYVEEELKCAKQEGEIDHLLGKQARLRDIKHQLVIRYPDTFSEVFDAIKITRADLQYYRYRKTFASRVSTYRNDQKKLNAYLATVNHEDNSQTQSIRHHQEALNSVREELIHENERLFQNVMNMMEKTDVLTAPKHPMTPVRSGSKKLGASDPSSSSSSPTKKQTATPSSKEPQERLSLIQGSKEAAFAGKVRRFKLISQFVEEELQGVRTHGEGVYLQRLKETLLRIHTQLAGKNPDRFQAAYDAATITPEEIQRYRKNKLFSNRVMKYKREEEFLQNQQAAVDMGKDPPIKDLAWHQRQLRRTREQLVRENENLFHHVMTLPEDGKAHKRGLEALWTDANERDVKHRRL